jgi:hypothetical protein
MDTVHPQLATDPSGLGEIDPSWKITIWRRPPAGDVAELIEVSDSATRVFARRAADKVIAKS